MCVAPLRLLCFPGLSSLVIALLFYVTEIIKSAVCVVRAAWMVTLPRSRRAEAG